jgi:ATP-dependent DNA helicase RecG
MRPEYMNFLFSTIDGIKGIGKKTLNSYSYLLNKKRKFLTVDKAPTMLDLLYHLPDRLLIRKKVKSVAEIRGSDHIIAKIKIVNHILPPTEKSPYKILGYLGDSFIHIIYYKVFSDWLKTKFPINKEVIVSGKVDFFDNQAQIVQPEYIDNYGNLNIPEFEPIYPLTMGITNKEISNHINFVLQNLPSINEWLPDDVLQENCWCSWKDSLLGLHKPQENFDIKNNKFLQRLVFDEFLAYQLSLMIIKKISFQKIIKNRLINDGRGLKNHFIQKLPFKLTNDQEKAIREIEEETFSSIKMNRLLQGDVGSGKTIVAFLCGLNYIENNKQVVLMAPTSILAMQHYENILKICEGEDINIDILVGKTRVAKKRQIIDDLKNGKINILIGTHALIEENIEFKDLGLTVIDEQQRFGVEQRLVLINKNKNSDILSMSATPIPRTLALTIYSDMDLTVIRQKPLNRKDITTSLVSMKQYNTILERIKSKFETDEKIFWICPLVEESEKVDLMNVKARYDELRDNFGEDRVSFIHGKMKEKDDVMEDFIKNDRKKILVATTVIEIGIDVKQATIIIIEHPERFGLSQLHQLRGRVGRNDRESFCILLFDHKNMGERSMKRLAVMRETNDGFTIAEEDLKLRGTGEILGVKQSGKTDFLIADIDRDMDLLFKSNALARKIINENSLSNYRDLLYMFSYVGYFDRDVLN